MGVELNGSTSRDSGRFCNEELSCPKKDTKTGSHSVASEKTILSVPNATCGPQERTPSSKKRKNMISN